jgi:hypothetical protein
MLTVAGRRCLFAMLLVAAIPWTAVASSPATPPPARCNEKPAIPANLLIRDEFMRSLVSRMIHRSPTFRGQLLTIGGTRLMLTRLRNVHRSALGSVLAQTTFGRSAAGYLVADIEIPSTRLLPRQNIEYIAHEIEHVLEQIERLNLPSLARLPHSGVRSVELGNAPSFETNRAKAAGLTVEREYFFAVRELSRCVGGVPDTAD